MGIMEISGCQLKDERVPFEQILRLIRRGKFQGKVTVEFHFDPDPELFYTISANIDSDIMIAGLNLEEKQEATQ